MPTYEYRCPEGHDFERFYRKISDASPQVACPECGKIAERKLSAGAGLLFKGSGFYLTDYGKNAHRGGPAPTKSDSGGDSGSASSTDGGSSKDSNASKDSGPSKDSGSAAKGESKPAESKPASEKKPAESKPAASSGSKPSKDK